MVKYEGFTTKQQEKVEAIINSFSENFINENFKKIVNAQELNDKQDKYATFGSYNLGKKELKINPRVFIVKDYDDSKRKMSKLAFIILHEVAHAIDRKFKLSMNKDWLKISGWVEDPIIKRGKKNLVIDHPDKEVQSQWYFNANNEDFPRWYSAMSPKEDFCDSFAFVFAGLLGRFKTDVKRKYINQVISKLKTEGVI